MADYFTLVAGSGHLKNFGSVSSDIGEEGRIVAADLATAQSQATKEIRSRLSALFSKTVMDGWDTTAPDIIGRAADLLGSAIAWEMKFSQEALQPSGEAEGLRKEALDLIRDIASGRVTVVKADGSVEPRVVQDVATIVSLA